jgi:hypothetical protein
MNRSLLAALLIIGATLPLGLAEPSQVYLTWDGSTLHEVHGDPNAVTPDHWEIWLYRASAPHNETGHWGSINQKTLEDVRRELKADQVFERGYEKFFGTSYGSATHFNPSAPIAVTKSTLPQFLDAYLELNETYEKLSNMREAFRASVDLTKPLATGESGPLSEYLKSLKDGFDRAGGLYKTLSVLHMPELAATYHTDRYGYQRKDITLPAGTAEEWNLDAIVKKAETERAEALGQRRSSEGGWMDNGYTDSDGEAWHTTIKLVKGGYSEIEGPPSAPYEPFVVEFSEITSIDLGRVITGSSDCDTNCPGLWIVEIYSKPIVGERPGHRQASYDNQADANAFAAFIRHNATEAHVRMDSRW